MFMFYGRNETSFVCNIRVSIPEFQNIKKVGFAVSDQYQFPRFLEENEFVLIFEVDKKGRPTGEDLTLFVNYINSQLIQLDVVNENPDVFWNKQKREVNHDL